MKMEKMKKKNGEKLISRSRYSSDWARRVTSLFARPSALASAWAAVADSSAGPF